METQGMAVNHILVPLDGSSLAEQAVPYALAIVKPGGTVTLFRAVPKPESIRDPLGGTLMTEQEVLTRHRLLAGESVVTAMTRWNEDRRAQIDVAIAVGEPVDEIHRAVQERSIDLIVMASKGRGAFGRLALGSVADRVARSAEVPVMLVRPDDALPDLGLPLLRRVVVPLDGSERADSAVPVALSLATSLHASIYLVSVAEFGRAAPSALAYGAAFSQQLFDEVMSGIEREALEHLQSVGAELATTELPVSWDVLSGSPAEAIIEVTRRGDLIVLTSHGRGGFRRWLLGSVAEKLVRHSTAPVMIVPARMAGVSESKRANYGEQPLANRL